MHSQKELYHLFLNKVTKLINRITIKKAVEYTGLSASWFRKHIKSGSLAVYKMPHDNRILINPKDIEALTPPVNFEEVQINLDNFMI